MRISGSMRVVLNAMIWPGMLVERASKKSVKISAADPDDGHVIKIYLIQVRYCGFSFHCNIFFFYSFVYLTLLTTRYHTVHETETCRVVVATKLVLGANG
jgi:hypothetical protein